MKFYLQGWLGLLFFILTACDAASTQPAITSTGPPSDTLTASTAATTHVLQHTEPAVQTQAAMHTAAAMVIQATPVAVTPTPTTFTLPAPPATTPTLSLISSPYPTWTLIPTFTPAPEVRTLAPPAECPADGTPIALTLEGLYTPRLDESIRAYLNARGSAAGLEAALVALTNNADSPDHVIAHVSALEVTGDGVPDVVMDLIIPEVGTYATSAVLIFACDEGQYETELFLLLSPQEGMYPQGGYHVLAVEDMNQDGVREVVVVLQVFEARRFYILAWDGTAFTSLVEPRFDDILLQTVYYIEAYTGEGTVIDMDGDGIFDLTITYNEDSARREIWSWNGQAFALVDD